MSYIYYGEHIINEAKVLLLHKVLFFIYLFFE